DALRLAAGGIDFRRQRRRPVRIAARMRDHFPAGRGERAADGRADLAAAAGDQGPLHQLALAVRTTAMRPLTSSAFELSTTNEYSRRPPSSTSRSARTVSGPSSSSR